MLLRWLLSIDIYCFYHLFWLAFVDNAYVMLRKAVWKDFKQSTQSYPGIPFFPSCSFLSYHFFKFLLLIISAFICTIDSLFYITIFCYCFFIENFCNFSLIFTFFDTDYLFFPVCFFFFVNELCFVLECDVFGYLLCRLMNSCFTICCWSVFGCLAILSRNPARNCSFCWILCKSCVIGHFWGFWPFWARNTAPKL